MPSMNLMVPLVCGALCLIILLFTWVAYAMGHGARAILRGMGLLLLVAGLYVSRLANLVGNGIQSIRDWALRTQMGTRLTAGLAMAGAGILFFLIGSVIRRRDREARRQVRKGRKGSVAAPASPAAVSPKASSSDDDEVEAILRSRGIS